MSHGSQMFLPFRSYVNLMVVLSMMWLTHYDHQLNAVHDVNLLFIYLEHKIKKFYSLFVELESLFQIV